MAVACRLSLFRRLLSALVQTLLPISDVGRIGGGQIPMPGEGSRAHHGVRFLDELPKCRRHVLAVLRQLLENSLTRRQSPHVLDLAVLAAPAARVLTSQGSRDTR
jgi:hypothetical protein